MTATYLDCHETFEAYYAGYNFLVTACTVVRAVERHLSRQTSTTLAAATIYTHCWQT
jgi:hypothetical protein